MMSYSQQSIDDDYSYRRDQSTATTARRNTTIHLGTVEHCRNKRAATPKRATGTCYVSVYKTDTGSHRQRCSMAPRAFPDHQRDTYRRGTSSEICGCQRWACKRVSVYYIDSNLHLTHYNK